MVNLFVSHTLNEIRLRFLALLEETFEIGKLETVFVALVFATTFPPTCGCSTAPLLLLLVSCSAQVTQVYLSQNREACARVERHSTKTEKGKMTVAVALRTRMFSSKTSDFNKMQESKWHQLRTRNTPHSYAVEICACEGVHVRTIS